MNVTLKGNEGVETRSISRNPFTTSKMETSFFESNMFSPVVPPMDFKKQFHWTNPWSTTLSKGLAAPLMNLPPLLFDWEKIPENYHHLRPPLYKNIKSEEGLENHRATSAFSEFSIESLTRKPLCTDRQTSVPGGRDVTSIIKSRGRPSAMSLQILKEKSLENPYKFKCVVCSRSFPRKKSLDTHKLVHSDVKPYVCTFPGCSRQFKQSGQLKTHYRLHTGEKPFKCTYPTCTTAFTHSNRKCSSHPDYPLQRISGEKTVPTSNTYGNVFGFKEADPLYKQKVDAWLKSQVVLESCDDADVGNSNDIENNPNSCNIMSSSSGNKNVLGSIENTAKAISLDHAMYEESNKRLLSAVALVELHDQTKTKMENNNKGLLKTLFYTPK